MPTTCAHDDIPLAPEVDAMTDTPISFQVEVEEAAARTGYPAGMLTEGSMSFYMQTAGSENLNPDTALKYNGANRKVEYKDGEWEI